MTSTYIDLISMLHFTLAPRHEDEGETRPLISNADRISRLLFPSLNLSIGDPILPQTLLPIQCLQMCLILTLRFPYPRRFFLGVSFVSDAGRLDL